jgi:hypothetical protein
MLGRTERDLFEHKKEEPMDLDEENKNSRE